MTRMFNYLKKLMRKISIRLRGTNYDRYMAKRRKNLSEEGFIALEVFGTYYEQEVKKLREAQLQKEKSDHQYRKAKRNDK